MRTINFGGVYHMPDGLSGQRRESFERKNGSSSTMVSFATNESGPVVDRSSYLLTGAIKKIVRHWRKKSESGDNKVSKEAQTKIEKISKNLKNQAEPFPTK